MSTVASLQVKIGADVSAAINGMSRAEFAANKVADNFTKAAVSSQELGVVSAVMGNRIAQAAQGAQQILNRVNFDTITQEGEKSFNQIQKIVDATANAGNAATLIGAGFVKAQQVAGVALTAVGAAIPTIGVRLAALAGPIGIAIGLVGALVGAFISYNSAQDNTIDNQETLRQKISEEKAELTTYFSVLNSGNLTYEKRGELIDKINDKYGTTLKNLTDETAFVNQTKKAYDDLVGSITNRIKAEVLAEQIKRTYIEIDTLKQKLKDVGKDAIPLPFPFNQAQIALYGKEFDNTKESISNLESGLDPMLKALALLENNTQKTTDKNKEGKKSVDLVAKAYKDLDNALQGIDTKLTQGLIKPLDVKDLQVDAFSSAIDKLISIDRTGSAAQKAIDRYKAFFDQKPVEIPAVIRQVELVALDNPFSGDAAKGALDKITADFANQQIPLKFDALPEGTNKLQDFLDKYLDKINTGIAITSQLGSQILNIANLAGNFEGRLNELENYYETEEKLIEGSIASDSVKAARKKQLEDETNKKRKAILKEQAINQKATSLFSAITNTASAVTKALAEGGPILAAVVGALGAVEIGLIAGTPIPALASGALISGPNTVLVGEYAGASSNPELISPVDKVKKYIVEAVESTNSGTSNLVGILRNDDLYFMMERANQRKFRSG